MKLRLNISKLIKIKDKLKRFKKSSGINGHKKTKLCKEFNITHDEINTIIELMAYDNMKEKGVSEET